MEEVREPVLERRAAGMLSHDLKIWNRLFQKGDEKMARAYYTLMIEPCAAALCYGAGV